MKTKISHLGRSTVSVILAVMMLLSTMLISTISVNAADSFTVGDTLYLDISGVSFNETDDNAGFYIKFYKHGTSDFSWSKLSQIDNSKVYSGTVPSGNWDHAVFTRVKNAFNSGVTWDEGNIYSSADTTITDKGDKNCWSLNDGKMNGAWTTYSGGSGGSTTEKNYYVAGSDVLVNGNAWTLMQVEDKMDYSESDKVYSITYTNKTNQKYLFKLNYENNWGSALGSSYIDNSECVGSTLADDGGAIQINFSDDVTTPANITIKYSLSTNKIWTEVVSNVTTHTVTYGVNNTSMGSVSAKSADADIASGAQVEKGKSVTFTAIPSEGYAVEGWYSDAECTNKIETAGTNKTYTVTVNANTNVYVKFRTAETYKVTFSSSNDNFGTVSATNGTTSLNSPATVTEGDEVTFTATPNEGYAVEGWYSDAGCTNKIESTGTNKTYTVKVNADTNVYVKFREAKKYTVTFRSSDETYGTISATNGTTPLNSPATVTEGDEVTFTATSKDGYALSGWTVNDALVSSTTNPYTITVQKDTTVVANFKVEDSGTIVNDMYFLYGSINNPASWEGQQGYNNPEYRKYDVYKKDGKYIVTLNKEHYKELYFAFSEHDSYVNMEPNTGLKAVNSDNPEGLRLVDAKTQEYYLGSVQYLFGKMSIVGENSEYIGDIKIIYDPTAKTYTVKATKDSVFDTTVNIVGKDGTIRAGYTDTVDKKTTAVLGDTELSITTPDNEIINASPSYLIDGENRAVTAKRVPYGSTVTVKTTINPDATFAGHSGSDYYVKGFSINGFTGGVLTQQDGHTHTSDVYEYTFTVKEDVYADVSTIEITPIYFLKNDSDCVTFYVENFMDAKAKWGDTIACYAYYSSDHALGDYPGQPMVNAEGSIYMQIPKHIGTDASNVVKGITLNNYVWDFVHVSGDDKARESKNCQTYDYDDFKYLANMSKVNSSDSADDIKNIVYRFKYHTYNNTSAEAGNVPKDTLTGTKVDDTKYEVFVDYYDKPTDIFGTIIKGNDAVTVDTVKAQPEYLTIVSDGYVNYYKDTANYLGQYATKWYIYNKAGQQVAALPPSALLYGLTKSSTQLENLVTQDTAPADFMSDSGASADLISGYWASFKSLYTKYAGKYAIINYESSIHSSGRDGAIKQPGERCDGRWYYSVDKAKITGDIKIEYADTLDSFTTMTGVKTDTFIEGTATGKNTAAEAYFTSPVDQSDARLTHVETTSDNSENFKFTVGATSSTTSSSRS